MFTIAPKPVLDGTFLDTELYLRRKQRKGNMNIEVGAFLVDLHLGKYHIIYFRNTQVLLHTINAVKHNRIIRYIIA